MNRRDLLKRAGALAVGVPALSASSLADPLFQSNNKPLIVSFTGPFCFWRDDANKQWIVMSPQLGKGSGADHEPWIGTSQNEKVIQPLQEPQKYNLQLPFAHTSETSGGTEVFPYKQEAPPVGKPMFNLTVPFADVTIGVRPTRVTLQPENSSSGGETMTLAAGLTLVYNNPDISNTVLTRDGDEKPYFRPCFDNDKDLPVFNLGIHLSPLHPHDPDHKQATVVWGKMLEMYPWMKKEVGKISFPLFDSASCPPKPLLNLTREEKQKILIGPGNICEVPIMSLTPNGPTGATRKR